MESGNMIHQYKLNGYNIVIDVNSGSIHVVDDVAYDIIGMYEERPRDEIRRIIKEKYDVSDEDIAEVFDDIEQLIDEKKLFSEDIFYDAAKEFKERQSVLKAICLHVAHDCNMDCEYCFAGKGHYHGDRGLMSYETGKRALDYLVENSPGRHNLEVDFFGGEPLLDWDVVKKLVAYGRSLEKENDKNFRFTLTTNGILLDDEVIDFTGREMSNVVISLDGRKEVNDRMRRTKNGGGTYDLIVGKFKKLADARGQKDYYMRGTYTANNLDFASDVLHMADLGFKELSIEPAVSSPEEPYALKDEHVEKLCSEYERLALEMIRRRKEGRGFTFYHYMIDLTGGPCISKRISGCGVGTEYMAVTPEGDLYPCHQFVGDKNFKLGTIFDGVQRPEVLQQFRSCNVYSHEECRDCFARLYCSGGCAANAFHSTGSVSGVYELGCRLHRKRIECAIMMKVSELFENQ
jgi:uncharacterized protein